jgi:hypothetical protein
MTARKPISKRRVTVDSIARIRQPLWRRSEQGDVTRRAIEAQQPVFVAPTGRNDTAQPSMRVARIEKTWTCLVGYTG